MKKSSKIAIVIVVILILIAVIVGVILLNKKKDNHLQNNNQIAQSNLNITTTEEMESLINQIYEGLEVYPTVVTSVIDINDENAVNSATGLTSTEKIDAIVISEPMISSQAYSMVLVKVKDSKDADSIAKEINEKINANKWICVAADKVYTTSSDNIVCLVMSNEEMAKPVYDKFKEIAVGIGQEYIRDNNEGIIDGFDNDGAIPAL